MTNTQLAGLLVVVVVIVGGLAWYFTRPAPAAVTVSPSSVDLSVKLGKSISEVLTLQNTGESEAVVSLELTGVEGTVTPSSVTVPAGESRGVSISVTGTTLGSFTGTLRADYAVGTADASIALEVLPRKLAIMFDIGGRGDLGFNDLAWIGSERAKTDFGVQVTLVQPRTEADYLPGLRDLASGGEYDLIVGVGWLLTEAMHTAAEEYPNQYFGNVDSGTGDPNVRGIYFKEHEGSALVGLLAGLVTESDVVAVVLGMDIPVLYKFEAGFYYGISYAENLTGKDVTILYKYTGSFVDRALGKLTTEGMLAMGADVAFNVAGLTGLGVLDAAHDYCVANDLEFGPPFAIGVDANQDWLYPGHVIASMEKRVDNGVYFTMRDVIYGNFTGGDFYYGIAEKGIGISKLVTLGPFMDIAVEMGVKLPDAPVNIIATWEEMRAKYPAWIWDALEEFETKILTGEIVVPGGPAPPSIDEIKAIRARYGVGVFG